MNGFFCKTYEVMIMLISKRNEDREGGASEHTPQGGKGKDAKSLAGSVACARRRAGGTPRVCVRLQGIASGWPLVSAARPAARAMHGCLAAGARASGIAFRGKATRPEGEQRVAKASRVRRHTRPCRATP